MVIVFTDEVGTPSKPRCFGAGFSDPSFFGAVSIAFLTKKEKEGIEARVHDIRRAFRWKGKWPGKGVESRVYDELCKIILESQAVVTFTRVRLHEARFWEEYEEHTRILNAQAEAKRREGLTLTNLPEGGLKAANLLWLHAVMINSALMALIRFALENRDLGSELQIWVDRKKLPLETERFLLNFVRERGKDGTIARRLEGFPEIAGVPREAIQRTEFLLAEMSIHQGEDSEMLGGLLDQLGAMFRRGEDTFDLGKRNTRWIDMLRGKFSTPDLIQDLTGPLIDRYPESGKLVRTKLFYPQHHSKVPIVLKEPKK